MKTKYLLIALFCLLGLGSQVFAQNTIKGIVKYQDQSAAIGATVFLKTKKKHQATVITDGGLFAFEDVSSGPFTLTVSSIGFEHYILEDILSTPTKELQITLSASTTQLSGVEILGRAQRDYNSDYSFSATKIAIKNKELPQAMSTITKELIADRQAFHLADAVKIASGVTPSSYYNQYAIRGISQNEEGQIINGLRTRQHYFLQPLTANIERVEVLKGPASVTFSSVDPGGSINIVTKKPLAIARKEISLSAGSFSTVRGTMDFTGPLNEHKTLLYRLNGAYQEARSFRDLIGNKSVLVSPSISYIPTKKTAINIELIFSLMSGNLDRGQPIFGAIAGKTNLNSTPISLNLGASNDFFKSKELILMGNFSHQFSPHIGFNVACMKQTWAEDLQEHRTTNAFATDLAGTPITSLVMMQLVQRKQFWNVDNLNAYFNFAFNLGKTSHNLLLGYDLQDWHKYKGGGQNAARGFLLKDGSVASRFNMVEAEKYQTITIDGKILPKPNVSYFNLQNPSYTIRNIQEYVLNSRTAVPSAFTSTDALYVQEQIKIGRFSTLLSLRGEWFEDITNYQTPTEKAFSNTALIPRIGLTYELNKNINVYGTFLQGYQPQSNTVTLMPITGNFLWTNESAARFKPLISDLKEFGLKAGFMDGRFTVNSALYEINQKNILMSANDPEKPDMLIQRGADRSRGFEIDLAGYLFSNWQINASYSIIDAKIVNDAKESLIGKRKENTPRHSGNLWTRYNFIQKNGLNDFGIGLGIQTQSNRIPWFTRDFEVPGFVVFDAAMYYTPNKSNLQIALNVNNLLNKTYWLGAQTYMRLFPATPRNFMFTATYRF